MQPLSEFELSKATEVISLATLPSNDFSAMKGKEAMAQSAVALFAKQFEREGYVTLFRGQADLTSKVLSGFARSGGLTKSENGLVELVEREQKQSQETQDWLAERRADESAKGNELLQAIYDREECYLRNTTVLERAALQHTQSTSESSCFISTSTSVKIAMGDYPGGSSNRYLYVLSVPSDQVIDIRAAYLKKDPEVTLRNPSHMLLREEEFVLLHEATSYVAAIIDLEDGEVYETRQLAA